MLPQLKTARGLLTLLLAALLLATAPAVGNARRLASEARKKRPVSADPGCVASSYERLLALLANTTACGNDRKVVYLDCAVPVLERGASAPLAVQHVRQPGDGEAHEPSVTIVGCNTTILVDLAANPALPALTVGGNGLVHSFAMVNARIAVAGAPAGGPPPACSSRPCAVPSVVDVHDVMHVTLKGVSVGPDAATPPAGGDAPAAAPMPYTCFTITNAAMGAPTVRLANVSASRCVDGIVVANGGNITVVDSRSTGNSNNGLYYSCSMLQRSLMRVHGRTGLNGNGASGLFVDCEGDLSPPLNVTMHDQVWMLRNGGSGAEIVGHVHADFHRGTRFSNNGWGPAGPPQCGGGLRATLRYGSPALSFSGVEFSNNTAKFGGGLCAEVPADAQPMPPVFKITGPIDLKNGTTFAGNVATSCGGALATVADVSKAKLSVSVGDGSRILPSNAAPKAPGWCVLADYTLPFIEIALH